MLPETEGPGDDTPEYPGADEPTNDGGVEQSASSPMDVGVPEAPGGGDAELVGRDAGKDATPAERVDSGIDVSKTLPDPEEAGEQVPQADDADDGEAARIVVSADDCARALRLAEGDFELAAAALGMSEATLRRRISTGGDPKLRAVHLKQTPQPPTAADVITRNKPPVELTEAELAEQIRKQDTILFREGLQAAGVKADTLKCLEILDGLSKNSGRFLVNSLDLSHRMMVYLNIQLLERANDIKKDYLDDETLDDEYKIEWQKAYNEIVDIIRKSYESTLIGTQAMAKIMAAAGGKKKDDDGGRKPGFSPLQAKPRK